MLAGVPYVIWPIGSVFILASGKKEDPFLHYHAIQGLLAGGALGIGFFLVMLFLFVFFRVMPGTATYLPAVFSMGLLFIGGALSLGIVLTAVYLGWRATEGEMLRLPFIGDYAEEKMLDQTGMTRRQFQAMLDASMEPENREEEIPFPELNNGATPRPASPRAQASPARSNAPAPIMNPKETAMDRLEAARRARAAHESAQQTHTFPAARPNPQPSSSSQVRDVDLIGHYKDKQMEPDSHKKDVLRNWLTSVDGEN